MFKSFIRPEKMGISLSLVCAIHCAALPFVITFLPLLGLEFLGHPEFEMLMLGTSVLIAFYLLYRDYWRLHRRLWAIFVAFLGFGVIFAGHLLHGMGLEIYFSLFGAFIIIAAYLINWRLVKEIKVCKC